MLQAQGDQASRAGERTGAARDMQSPVDPQGITFGFSRVDGARNVLKGPVEKSSVQRAQGVCNVLQGSPCLIS